MNWNIVIVSIVVVLAAFAIYKEVRRPNRGRLVLRILSVIVALMALACLALPLTYQKEIEENTVKKLILLTPGFNADSLKHDQNTVICTFDTAVSKAYPKAKLVTSVSEATADANQRQLHVYGYGLTGSELAEPHKNFVFHPSQQPDGFTAVHWSNQLNTGERLAVQGRIQNTSGKPVTLALNGIGTTLDSVKIPAGVSQTFVLSTMPKQVGRAVYHLIGVSKGDTLYNELLPVTINQAVPVRLLVLSSSPDFESKFLKNWLGANGYAVASRSLITKGKYSQELLNMEKTDLTRLTGNLLQKFDLVVTDLSSVNTLSPAENAALQQEISDNGLGLLIRADSADKLNTWPVRGFALGRIAGRPAAGVLQIAGNRKSSAKMNSLSVRVNPNNNQQILASDIQGNPLIANTLYGSGKIGITLISNSFNWMLEGNQVDYASLWSVVISNVARKQNSETSATVSPQFPVQNAAANISTSGNVTINGISIATQQNPNVPFQQSGTYWPEEVGWQQTSMAGVKPYWWFAWPKNSWANIRAGEKLQATQAHAAAQPAGSMVTKQIQELARVPVPKIYFYVLLLVALAFLWAEAKYAGY